MRLKRHPYGYVTLDDRYIVQQDSTEIQDGCECIICQQGSLGCPHNGWRVDRGWVVWDQVERDYLQGTGPLEFETKRAAVDYLEDHLSKREGVR